MARITTGFAISTIGGVAYTVIQYYAYKLGPCGYYGASDPVCVDNGLVAPISIWWQSIPFALGGLSELFVLVPAFGIAYSRAPVNMRGLVSALNLFSQGFAYIINLALSGVINDPYLLWDFGGPAIVGAVVTVFFVGFPAHPQAVWFADFSCVQYFQFRSIDKEEFVLSTNQVEEAPGTRDDGSNKSGNALAIVAETTEQTAGIPQKA